MQEHRTEVDAEGSVHRIGSEWEVRWRDPLDAEQDHDVERTQRFESKADADEFARKIDEIGIVRTTDEHGPHFESVGTPEFDVEHPRAYDAIHEALAALLLDSHPEYTFHTAVSDNDPDGRRIPLSGSIEWSAHRKDAR